MNEHGSEHSSDNATAPVPGDNAWARFLACLEERHSLTDLTQIGKGGMGRVYRARDRDLNRWVAVKVLESTGGGPDSLQRFRQESRILGQLRHPAIVGVHSARTSPEGVAYFVMDYVEGGDLGALIAERRGSGGSLTVAETVELLRPVADALDTIHRMRPQVIHRDVKPANILVPDSAHRDSAWNVPLLTDFGISLTQDGTRLTSAGFLIGTDRYMAPEQFRSVHGGPVPGASVDLYAFALIVFEMLTLRPLRETMSQEAWRFARRFPAVPAHALAAPDQSRAGELVGVLARALADDPSQRYASAREFLNALESADAGAVTPAAPTAYTAQTAPPPSIQTDRKPHRSRRLLLGAVALLSVAVLVVGGIAVTDTVRHPGWSGDEKAMAAALPQVLPDRQNDAGWLGMTCSAADAGDGERARITCRGGGRTLIVADFGDAGTRDRLGSSRQLQELSDGPCVIKTGPVGDAQVALPQAEGKERYSLLLASDTAEEDLRGIPVCS